MHLDCLLKAKYEKRSEKTAPDLTHSSKPKSQVFSMSFVLHYQRQSTSTLKMENSMAREQTAPAIREALRFQFLSRWNFFGGSPKGKSNDVRTRKH